MFSLITGTNLNASKKLSRLLNARSSAVSISVPGLKPHCVVTVYGIKEILAVQEVLRNSSKIERALSLAHSPSR